MPKDFQSPPHLYLFHFLLLQSSCLRLALAPWHVFLGAVFLTNLAFAPFWESCIRHNTVWSDFFGRPISLCCRIHALLSLTSSLLVVALWSESQAIIYQTDYVSAQSSTALDNSETTACHALVSADYCNVCWINYSLKLDEAATIFWHLCCMPCGRLTTLRQLPIAMTNILVAQIVLRDPFGAPMFVLPPQKFLSLSLLWWF